MSAQEGGGVCLGRGCLPKGCTPPTAVDRMADACENITFPQLLLRMVIMDITWKTYRFNRERQLSLCACFMHCAKFMLTLFLFSGIRLHVLHPSVHTERPDLGLQGQHICACTRQRGTCLYLCNVMYVVTTRFANVICKIKW